MDADMWMKLLGSAAIEGIILGAIIGFLWSMASKVLQWFLIGQFILLKWLESRGILIVDWERLTLGLVENGNKALEEVVTLLESFVELGTFGASFAVGFWIVNKRKA
ncbi:MAG: FUN14 domain-containing protein [Euryarchaeota archaeon]|tara:strand:+ start:496 stop:816 length:321 start_codon:yes stop_codon:yes gene_type:complete